MKYLLILLLSGCATPPQFLAAYYNSNDPCQLKTEARPSFCGAGGKVIGVVRTVTGKPVNVITAN